MPLSRGTSVSSETKDKAVELPKKKRRNGAQIVANLESEIKKWQDLIDRQKGANGESEGSRNVEARFVPSTWTFGIPPKPKPVFDPKSPLQTHVLNLYFTSSHTTSGMINSNTLMSFDRATNDKYPLLLHHAIMASGLRLISPSWLEVNVSPLDRYWETELGASIDSRDSHTLLTQWHFQQAEEILDTSICAGYNVFESLQAAVLLAHEAYFNAKFLKANAFVSTALRIATSMGLHHIRAKSQVPPPRVETSDPLIFPRKTKHRILEETDDVNELYLRSITFWFAIAIERFIVVGMDCASCISDQNITSILPTYSVTEWMPYSVQSPLSPVNPNFLVDHPPHLIQPLQLFFKSVVLLGRVKAFLQDCPPPIGHRGVSILETLSDFECLQITETVGFQSTCHSIKAFFYSLPKEYQHTPTVYSDARVPLIFMLPQIALILLYEPFCSLSLDDSNFTICLDAARTVMNLIYSIWSSSFEYSHLIPLNNLCWNVVGRTLVRHLALQVIAGASSDQLTTIRNDITILTEVMKGNKSILGAKNAEALMNLLNTSESCLPRNDSLLQTRIAIESGYHSSGLDPLGFSDATGNIMSSLPLNMSFSTSDQNRYIPNQNILPGATSMSNTGSINTIDPLDPLDPLLFNPIL